MRIAVNDEILVVPDDLSLQELIGRLTLPAERLAIELNGIVVRRTAWPQTKLNDDDRVEIVHFVGGG